MKPLHISVSDVTKSFASQTVLQSISFNIYKGEIFGLLGPSGAGKTTLVKMMAGIEIPSSGTIKINDVRMPHLDTLNKIGYMTQADALYNELTALENLEFFATIYRLKGALKKERIQEVIELVNLDADLKKPISNYSGGMKRRLSLAISLLHRPEVLILDEPTVGIDPVLRQSIWNELNMLSNAGTTIIVTTHVMDEAEKCDRLGMLRNGKLLAIGSSEELKNETRSESLEQVFLHYGGARG